MAAFLHVLVCFFSDRTIAFFLPCWLDSRRFVAAVCANFQIIIIHFKLKIRGAGEGDGDGRWEWDGMGGWANGFSFLRMLPRLCVQLFCNYVIVVAFCKTGVCT